MFTGKKYQNDVTLRHTVLNLKGMLMKSSEIHVNKQKLIFRDNEMKVLIFSIYLFNLFFFVHSVNLNLLVACTCDSLPWIEWLKYFILQMETVSNVYA